RPAVSGASSRALVLRCLAGDQTMIKASPQARTGSRPALAFPGYELLERCWSDAHASTFRARDTASGREVLIKAPISQWGRPKDSEYLAKDYEFARSRSIEGILRPLAYLEHEGAVALVIEDDGAVPIGELFLVERLGLDSILEIGCAVALILE